MLTAKCTVLARKNCTCKKKVVICADSKHPGYLWSKHTQMGKQFRLAKFGTEKKQSCF